MTRPQALGHPRIAIIAPIVARYDAISSAARSDFCLLSAQENWNVTFLTSYNEASDLPARIIPGVTELLQDAEFRSADILIYHFGIYHPFLDALLIGNGHAKQVVVFHNITPPELVSPAHRSVIERSYRQLHNLRHADEIWAVSNLNAQVLIQHSIDPQLIAIVPLAVERPALGTLRQKLAHQVEILFVGRIVPAKGVRDLIEAARLAQQVANLPFRIRIAGNQAFSDSAYLDDCKTLAQIGTLAECIEFVATPNDEDLDRLYTEAHILSIPSYHEGFCVPVVEALRAGCVPVGYTAGNIPAVAGSLGRLVPAGDIGALAAALAEVSSGIVRACDKPEAKTLPLDCGLLDVDAFDAAARAHIQNFDTRRIAAIKTARLGQLLADCAAVT